MRDNKLIWIPGSAVFRFWKNVSLSGPDDCWLWKSSTHDGYGKVRWMNTDGIEERVLAHRLSFLFHNGWLDAETVVRHSCDTPLCVNPKHLMAGTLIDNNRDRMERNRHAKGTAYPQAKLNDEKVREMRRMHRAERMTYTALGKLFGVSDEVARRVIHRKIWTHVPEEKDATCCRE